ncbi:MAG: PEP-CTERM sorting domain-containing protein [Phycisphaerae bacterium]|nr:PEP-CTERM sorting domain-containing protein [Phycisphaerae bacterium]
MSCPKVPFFAFFVVVLFSSLSFATPVPASGNYDIDNISAAALLFDHDPWVSPSMAKTAFITVYATNDYVNVYAGASSVCNLSTLIFMNGGQHILDNGAVSGDLAIRFGNSTTDDITFAVSVLTINFASGAMDVFLPEFTLAKSENMHLWVANDGSTYFANVSGNEGSWGIPNISAQQSIADGYIAAVPEPATIVILGLGAIFLCRRKNN